MWREFRPNPNRQSPAMLNMKTRRLLIVISFLVALGLAQDAARLTAAEAQNHVGESATVCGKVASTYYAFTKGRRPTFLSIDKPYPNEIFTVLIWGSDRLKFDTPEERYKHKSICATGQITSYRGVAQIIAHDPEQIKIQ
jgi:hypothetical protein